MAIVNFSQAARMDSPYNWQFLTATFATASRINVTDNNLFSANFYGSFSYNDTYISGGTVTRYDLFYNGSVEYSLTGANLSAIAVNNHLAGQFSGELSRYSLSGNDTVNGTASSDVLWGWSGNDILNGGLGDDRLNGANGDFVNRGRTLPGVGSVFDIDNAADIGNDILNGGDGNDTADYSTVLTGVNVNLSITTSQNTLGAGIDTLINIENITGSSLNDTLTGNNLNNILNGRAGNDTLNGGIGADTLIGGLGDDTYIIDNMGDIVDEKNAVNLQLYLGYQALQNYNFSVPLPVPGISAPSFNSTRSLDGRYEVFIQLGNVQVTDDRGNLYSSSTIGGNLYVKDNFTNTTKLVYNTNSEGIPYGLNGADNGHLYLTDDGSQIYFWSGDDLGYLSGINTIGVNNTYKIKNPFLLDTTTGGIDTAVSSINYTLSTYVENLTLTGLASINGTGNVSNNTILGNIGENIIDGGNGDDLLRGDAGNDSLIGGLGNDTIGGGLGNDTLSGGDGNDYLHGGMDAGNDTLNGGTGNDTLISGDGNDLLGGGIGNDVLNGGAGNDSYFIDVSSDVIEADVSGVDTVNVLYSVGSYSLAADLENINLLGIANINGIGNPFNNTINGNIGDNQIDGGNGDDLLRGDAGNDTLIGGDGNDTLGGGIGSDIMNGGAGNDSYFIDVSSDVIEADVSGVDTVNVLYSVGSYSLAADLENINLLGTANINGIGNAFNNTIIGNIGDNQIDGGNGDDLLRGDAGNDTLNGGDGNDTLGGGIGNDILNGGAGNDLLFGGADGGNDTLNGGAGNDILNGGAGQDFYVFNTDLDATNNKDTIQGFNVLEDLILLDYTKFNAIGIYLEESEFRSGAGVTTASTANQHIIFNTSTGALYYDADGVGGTAAIQFATLTNTLGALNNFSFLLGIDFSQIGTDQADTLNGTSGDDAINGLAGNDIINGGPGADIMYGDLGDDTFYVDNVDDIVFEDYFYFNESNGLFYENGYYNLGFFGGHPNNTNTIFSSVTYTADFGIGNLTLTGSDNINGYGSNQKINIITGNDGNNILDGGIITNPELMTAEYVSPTSPYIFFQSSGGYDTLIGGKGDDTYIVRGGETIIENANEGVDTYILSYNTGIPTAFLIDPASEIENFILANDNVLHDNISGTNKDNLIVANSIANNIYGLAGNDELKGMGGDDKLFGMSGNDILWGGTGRDTFVFESAGTVTYDIVKDFVSSQDKIRVSDGIFFRPALLSGIYTDMFFTGTTAQDGNDYFIYNRFTGDLYFDEDGIGAISQQLIANFLPNTVLLHSDFVGALNTTQPITIVLTDQLITGSAFNDSLAGGAGNDTINAGAGNDTLNGGDGNDKLNGEADNDTLFGMGGDETLNGGAGNDFLSGGLGSDTFVWNLADRSTNGLPAIDRISDFSLTNDKLDLRDLLVGESVANILNFLDITTSNAAGVTNTEIRISNTGGFASGTFAAAAENQHITLAGVNLLAGTNEADLLVSLIAQNKMIIDV